MENDGQKSRNGKWRYNLEEIRWSFDLVGYASNHFGARAVQHGRRTDLKDAKLGGFVVFTDEQKWWWFSENVGGDCFDLVGYMKNPKWFDLKYQNNSEFKRLFAEVVEECAYHTGAKAEFQPIELSDAKSFSNLNANNQMVKIESNDVTLNGVQNGAHNGVQNDGHNGVQNGVQNGVLKAKRGRPKSKEEELVIDLPNEAVRWVSEKACYVIENGAFHYIEQMSRGVREMPLCNFTAEILRQLCYDDGENEVVLFYEIAGKLNNGQPLPKVIVSAKVFQDMKWIGEKWGADAIPFESRGALGHIKTAILLFSKPMKQRVLMHTGWHINEKGERIYVSHGHLTCMKEKMDSLSPDLISELDPILRAYQIPNKPSNDPNKMIDALNASLSFLNCASPQVTFPMFSAIFLAPLSEILPINFALWLHGETGSFKSTLAALALCHYGAITPSNFIGWSSTSNAIERYLFMLKDAPAVVDDYAPQQTPQAQQKLEQLVSRLIRDNGNSTGRLRLKSDLSFQKVFYPRGLVMVTGEQLPDVPSLLARLFVVNTKKKDVNLDNLSTLQDISDLLPLAMSAYLHFVSNNWDDIKVRTQKVFKEIRNKLKGDFTHARSSEAIATLYAAFDIAMLFFEQSLPIIPKHYFQKLRDTCFDVLANTQKNQEAENNEENPIQTFLSTLHTQIAQNKVKLNPLSNPFSTTDNAPNIGWYDDNYIYLLFIAAYGSVSKHFRDIGQSFYIKDRALRKMLKEHQILMSDANQYTSVVRVKDTVYRVAKLDRKALQSYNTDLAAVYTNSYATATF